MERNPCVVPNDGMECKFDIALQLHEQQVTRVCTEAPTKDVKSFHTS